MGRDAQYIPQTPNQTQTTFCSWAEKWGNGIRLLSVWDNNDTLWLSQQKKNSAIQVYK